MFVLKMKFWDWKGDEFVILISRNALLSETVDWRVGKVKRNSATLRGCPNKEGKSTKVHFGNLWTCPIFAYAAFVWDIEHLGTTRLCLVKAVMLAVLWHYIYIYIYLNNTPPFPSKKNSVTHAPTTHMRWRVVDWRLGNGRKWANALFKKTIQHFTIFPKLIREMPLF